MIRNSVNFPAADMPRNTPYRITIVNKNVPNMVGQISTSLANAGLNIADLLNKSLGDIAYTIVDLDAPVSAELIAELEAIEGVVRVRSLEKA